jgi:hypothetical protein
MSILHDVVILLCKKVTSTSQKLIRIFCCAKYDTHFLLAGWCGALVVSQTGVSFWWVLERNFQ